MIPLIQIFCWLKLFHSKLNQLHWYYGTQELEFIFFTVIIFQFSDLRINKPYNEIRWNDIMGNSKLFEINSARIFPNRYWCKKQIFIEKIDYRRSSLFFTFFHFISSTFLYFFFIIGYYFLIFSLILLESDLPMNILINLIMRVEIFVWYWLNLLLEFYGDLLIFLYYRSLLKISMEI